MRRAANGGADDLECDWRTRRLTTWPFPESVIMKTPENIKTYQRVLDQSGVEINSLLELGIMRGGSVALFNALLNPRDHLAVDIVRRESGLPRYEEIVRAQGRNLMCRYDISQDDDSAIGRCFTDMSGEDRPEFDLIIDDASHGYDVI